MDPAIQSRCSKYLKFDKEAIRGVGESKDIISNLPECILNYILTFLPTNDTLRTSILSTRWRDLWTSMPNIDLGEHISPTQNEALLLDLVDRIFCLHDASDIKTFRLRFRIPVNPSRVNRWVSSAVKHQMQELELSLPFEMSFLLPCCLFTSESLVALNLEMSVLKVPTSVRLLSLVRLYLSIVRLSDENAIERLLSNCPMLQELTFRNCDWVNIKRITLTLPSLKSFTLFNDFNFQDSLDCTIEIYSSNLVILNYESDLKVNCLIYNLPLSVNASIDFLDPPLEVNRRGLSLLHCLQNVKSLMITGGTLMCMGDYAAARVPTFCNLTTLTLTSEISIWTIGLLVNFLQNSPNVESLAIQNEDRCDNDRLNEDWDLEKVPGCFGSHLKTISLSDFLGNEEEIYLVKALLKHTTVLERMMIHYFRSNSEMREQVGSQSKMWPRGSERCVIELLYDAPSTSF